MNCQRTAYAPTGRPEKALSVKFTLKKRIASVQLLSKQQKSKKSQRKDGAAPRSKGHKTLWAREYVASYRSHYSNVKLLLNSWCFGNLRCCLQDHTAHKRIIDMMDFTWLTLDVSRELHCLANFNYVRGNETSTIKIVDFRFCKNLASLLPPELLSTALSHVQSDVCSFGVVLYQVITFRVYSDGVSDDH